MATTPRTTFFGFATITTTCLPFPWRRRQPFAMTINASQANSFFVRAILLNFTMQGQTLKKVGVWLVDGPAFSHAQLYVAASR